jgi:tetratricopeptide (TPR) repeat protein
LLARPLQDALPAAILFAMLRFRFIGISIVLSASVVSAQPRADADMCTVPPGAQPSLPAKLLDGVGVTNMPVTTKSPEAQKFFNQGVAQLHSFWAIEAERSFLHAAALDPDMAMAYWGIAMAAAGDYRPTFQLLRDPYDGGRMLGVVVPEEGKERIARDRSGAAINGAVRAREAIEKAMGMRDRVTERERLYIISQAVRRDPKIKDKDIAYVAALRTLVAVYPDDNEAKSFLGLALLNGYDPVTKAPRDGTMEGLRLLEAIVANDDRHFGAHHYLIHGYEGGLTPEKAWRACERYPQLVPNVPHALHMPGHIYAQSDRIDDAVDAFSAAAKNELGYMAADVLYPNGHHGHNVHFLVHALNLEGRFRESMEQVRHLLSFGETPRERAGDSQRVTWRQGYYALVKTLVRFERWDQILDGTTIPTYDKPVQRAWRAWGVGLAASAKGDLGRARTALADFQKARAEATASKGPLTVGALELEATIAARAGDRAKGYELFRKAADTEAALIYTEPPSYPRPVVEGWGNVALAFGDYDRAERAFREALAREPGSGRAFFGAAQALDGLGRAADAREMRQRAERAWNKADPDLRRVTSSAAAR